MKLHVSYSSEKTDLAVGKEIVQAKPYQIIVWVSVCVPGLLDFDPKIPKLPAILDPGDNHNFSISEDHLRRWAGLDPRRLKEQRRIRKEGEVVQLRSASLWLHGDEPYPLDVGEGIAVFKEGPRLPLLGLRAITKSRLRMVIKGDQKKAIIRTPPKRFWPF